MNDIGLTNSKLPATIEDLSKFVLIGREKLSSVRAEIRAIDKLQLAQEVRDQKRDEARMLSEALLDAEVRLGEMLQALPKADKGNQYTGKMVNRNSADNQKPKYQAVNELGLSLDQAERFETLANNKDLVEQVKAEARENDDLPTRTAVLSLAKARGERFRQEGKRDDEADARFKEFRKATKGIDTLRDDEEFLQAVVWSATIYGSDKGNIDYEVEYLNRYIDKLNRIKHYFLKEGGRNGKK